MSNRKIFASLVCLTLLIAATFGVRAFAEDKPAAGDASAMKGMTPEMMAEMAALSKPGPQHAQLAKYVGDFKADVQMWMDPSQPPMKSEGKLHNEMALGGKFLMGTYEGTFMDQPFHGMSCSGYDNGKKKWTNGWVDDMSTGTMYAEGDADESGKTITLTAEMYCPQTKGLMKVREITKFVDDDHMTYEMHMPGPDGKEMKCMEINYTRVK